MEDQINGAGKNKKVLILIFVVIGVVILAIIGFVVYLFILSGKTHLINNELGGNLSLGSQEKLSENASAIEKELLVRFGEDYNPPPIN